MQIQYSLPYPFSKTYYH